MSTRVTVKGQVTLPKSVRDAVGIRAGDRVAVRATAAGTVVIEKAPGGDSFKSALYALARRRPLRGTTTDTLMAESRGEPEPGRK
jgi:AbrB family looped-hinge helix DNA binding protein